MKSFPVKTTLLVICAIAVGVFVAGCGSKSTPTASDSVNDTAGATQSTAASSTPSSKIAATLSEYAINTDSSVAKAGKVTFDVKNDGNMPHEMVVLKTDTPAGKLKVTNGRVSEKDSVGEVSDIAGGKSKSGTLDLKPGKYVLVCNLPGHYQQGMYAALIVK